MQSKQKAATLRKVIALLEEADILQQEAIGMDTDVSYELHTKLQELIEDITYDVIEFDNAD